MDEKALETLFVTTPNQIWKAAKEFFQGIVLKDPGKEVEGSSLKAATGDHVEKAAKRAEKSD